MAISDKTRKILWGRSGNRCAICRHELVVDATPADDESLVGEECHIVSPTDRGPRFDESLPDDQLDDQANLILLCRIHHKMVDDQQETYTAELLRTLKENHEKWVSSLLAEKEPIPPIRIRRIKGDIPTHLVRLRSGRAVLAIVDGACGFAFEHDELESQAEVELVSGFLQEAQDYGDLSGDLEAGDRVKGAFEMSARLDELEQAGFWVFGGREIRRLEGGVGSPSPFPVAILAVLRPTSPEIIWCHSQRQGGDDTMARILKKDEAHKIVDRLPPNATWDDLMREIYVCQTIERGLADSEEGRTRDVKEVVQNTTCLNEGP